MTRLMFYEANISVTIHSDGTATLDIDDERLGRNFSRFLPSLNVFHRSPSVALPALMPSQQESISTALTTLNDWSQSDYLEPKWQNLKEREKKIWWRENRADMKEKQLEEREKVLKRKEASLKLAETEPDEKDKLLKEKEDELERKESSLEGKEQQLEEKKQHLEEKEQQLQEKEMEIDSEEANLKIREQSNNEKEQQLEEKAVDIEQKRYSMEQKEKQLEEKEVTFGLKFHHRLPGDKCKSCNVIKCKQCPYLHLDGRCFATGKECNLCGEYGHFRSHCPKKRQMEMEMAKQYGKQ